MIVLANEEFSTGLRLAGVKKSHYIKSREQGESILKEIGKKEFIIATEKVLELLPELEDYSNLVVFPETIDDFSKIDDLKRITKKAIGSEVEI
jgi:vacuolar-type H+-ATPase subunit F/Vma7